MVRANFDHIEKMLDQKYTSAFISGHLIVESLFIQIIEENLALPKKFDTSDLRFPHKANLCVALGILPEEIAKYLIKLNLIRNKLAHHLDYKLEIDDIYNLFKDAKKAGIEFSDELVFLDSEYIKEEFWSDDIISELFQNVIADLTFFLKDHTKFWSRT